MLAELRAILAAARNALGVRVAITMFFAGLCAGTSFLLIPIPIAIAFLGGAATFAGGRNLDNDYERLFGAGALAAIGLLPFLGSLLIGATFLSSLTEVTAYRHAEMSDQVAGLAIQVASATLGTVAVAPILAAAELRAAGSSTIGEALARSIAIASRRPIPTMLAGALQGLLFSVPVVAFVLVHGPTRFVLALVGSCVSWTLYPALGRGLATASTCAPRRLGWLLLPTTLCWIGALAICAAVASPLHDTWSRGPLDRDAGTDVSVDREGPHHLQLTTPRGTTHLRSHGWLQGRGTTWVDAPTGHVIACATVGRGVCLGTELDASFERMDDGLAGRWRARFGSAHLAMLVAALVAIGWALVRVRRAARAVPMGMGTRVVLRLAGDAAQWLEDGRVVPRGDVHLASTDHDRVVVLDRPLPVVLADGVSRDGAELTLVTSGPIAGLGPRVGASSLPDGAWLAGGLDVATARALHLARAAAVPATLAVLSALLGASLPLLSL